ncbi:MAG: hypothetical protein HC849_26185 [Oscillatoriales cyanobacterium RU_3_3]|nr:hypothetical protein [Microcoleus sp. SU_5_6]NJL68899.1 hypothetical protein [Microcoleus sp. SM1_3_4]NJM62886.1 hypothetical protein [Oscillatoriales cyanobacterium RU_3_3]NJR24315.1 hypothetical protein [Richelia sp. CSU_2_1]
MKKLILLTGMLLMVAAKTAFASPAIPQTEEIAGIPAEPKVEQIARIAPDPTAEPKDEQIDRIAADPKEEPKDEQIDRTATSPKVEPIERMSAQELRETIDQPTVYIFDGIKGRELTLSLWAGQLTAELYSPSGENLGSIEKRDNQWVGRLPESGIYRVRVTPKGETSSFVLERDFNAKWVYRPDRPMPIAFRQSKGSVRLKMSGYQVQPLTVQARRGQTMRVTASNKNADVAIESPSGQLLDQGEGQTFAQLPESGVYRVLVVANRPIGTSIGVALQ